MYTDVCVCGKVRVKFNFLILFPCVYSIVSTPFKKKKKKKKDFSLTPLQCYFCQKSNIYLCKVLCINYKLATFHGHLPSTSTRIKSFATAAAALHSGWRTEMR